MRRIVGILLMVIALGLAACGSRDETPAAEAPAAAATEAPAAEAPAAEATEAPAEEADEAPAEEPMAEGEMVTLPEVDVLAITGDIITAGSSTVFPLTEAMATRFTDEGYAGNITVDSIGSGAGLERFCVAGESDIANSSHAIEDSEIESCAAINRTPIEFPRGYRCPGRSRQSVQRIPFRRDG